MTDKIEKYINRTKRLMAKHPNIQDGFPGSTEKTYSVNFLMRWLDWKSIPICSMSKQDLSELREELTNLLIENSSNKQLDLF